MNTITLDSRVRRSTYRSATISGRCSATSMLTATSKSRASARELCSRSNFITSNCRRRQYVRAASEYSSPNTSQPRPVPARKHQVRRHHPARHWTIDNAVADRNTLAQRTIRTYDRVRVNEYTAEMPDPQSWSDHRRLRQADAYQRLDNTEEQPTQLLRQSRDHGILWLLTWASVARNVKALGREPV